jgi:hypothetical protein
MADENFFDLYQDLVAKPRDIGGSDVKIVEPIIETWFKQKFVTFADNTDDGLELVYPKLESVQVFTPYKIPSPIYNALVLLWDFAKLHKEPHPRVLEVITNYPPEFIPLLVLKELKRAFPNAGINANC